MIKTLFLLSVHLLPFSVFASNSMQQSMDTHSTIDLLELLPTPKTVKKLPPSIHHTGIIFTETKVSSISNINAPEFLINQLEQKLKLERIDRPANFKGCIVTEICPDSTLDPESYTLSSNGYSVFITAPTEKGLNWGLQTLYQLATPLDNAYRFPLVEITDAPQYSYRGMHLDVARYFFTVAEVKQFIDYMQMHKLNKLQWHLTDDQGWRIEIKKYPKLQEISTKRESSPKKGARTQSDDTPYGPFFYTQDEIKDVVKYAQERGIEVIPEIEMPGHAQAVLAAYPQLGCTKGPYKVWTTWGVSDNVFCAGNSESIQFIKDVIDEILPLFPSKFIHIGGDECPKDQWRKCPNCIKKAQSLQLKKVDDLQGYFITEIANYIEKKGKHIVGWDEILEDGDIPQSAIIMAWRGEQHGIRGANKGHRVIMTPNSVLYFNYCYSKRKDEPEMIGNLIPLEKTYFYNPVKGVKKEFQKNIIGVQANCWSEYFFNFKYLEYAIFPRMSALSEISWAQADRRDYARYQKQLLHYFLRLDALEKRPNYRCFPIEFPEKIFVDSGMKYTFLLPRIENNKAIQYWVTTDGREPEEQHITSETSLSVTSPAILKIKFKMPSGRLSPTQTLMITPRNN